MSSVSAAHPVVATWLVGEKEVSVHKEQNRLTFSIRNGGQIERENQTISTEIYTLERSEVLIRMFREVIQAALANGISQYSFLPVLCTDAWILERERYESTRFQTALFGRIVSDRSRRGEVTSKIVGAWWGIFNPSNRAVSQFAVDEGSAAAGFLTNIFGRKGEEYNFYARQVKPVITLGAEGRVESVALKHFSTFDTNVTLDENHWAVTLVSSKAYATVGSCGSRSFDHGHGMIAYEGVIEQRQFLKFAHITTADRVRGVPDTGRNPRIEARVEISDRTPASLSQGPTWKRERHAVENMLRPIEEAVRRPRYVRFGIMSDVNEDVSRRTTSINRRALPLAAMAYVSGSILAILSLRLRGPKLSGRGATRPARESMLSEAILSMTAISLLVGHGTLIPRGVVEDLVSDYRINKLVFVVRTLFAAGVIGLPIFIMSFRLPNAARMLAGMSLFSASTQIVGELFAVRDQTVNCISWCRGQLRNANIEIHGQAWTKITPHAVVAHLSSHPEAATLR